ncbi:hypothetical protein G6F40_014992 [Rhizopus arrhizus]|nr:hypothetical protein G6F40_014992 [Rhizopus arrhizus]
MDAEIVEFSRKYSEVISAPVRDRTGLRAAGFSTTVAVAGAVLCQRETVRDHGSDLRTVIAWIGHHHADPACRGGIRLPVAGGVPAGPSTAWPGRASDGGGD